MRKILVFAVFSLAGMSVAAQQQPPSHTPKQDKEPPAKQQDNLEKRTRVEGSAGGTASVPAEARQGVGAGAKPHIHDDRLDRGLHRRSEDPVIEPSK